MLARWCLALALVFATAGFAAAQKPDAKKEDPKKDDAKKDDTKTDPKKERGFLPTYWKMLGLSEDQIQKVYKVQNKYGDEIDELEGKIKGLKDKMAKERGDLLTAEQKKRLEEIIKEKSGTGDKPKDK
jgi:septal ring factor EnvC (AmiA/AmiB activator)